MDRIEIPESFFKRPPPTDLKVGDRVCMKAESRGQAPAEAWTGTVAIVPDADTRVLPFGHDFSGDVAVDLDSGGRGVAPASCWERV